ncbi:MAG: hypothetical protein Q8O67_26750 [Deltaproteobacteria bacterium]|nr:hypothetical protein [Deltaproteobacteria bacterium]
MLGLVAHMSCQECCNDHDCTLAGGDKEFCVDGACVVGEAPVQDNDECTADGDCGTGVCVQGTCAVAPSCLRLERTFIARLNAEPELGTVTATTSACEVTFSYELTGGLSSSATVERVKPDGTFVGAVGLREGTGVFDPALRVGSFGVGVTDNIVFGTETYGCVDDDDCARQLLTTCADGVCQ